MSGTPTPRTDGDQSTDGLWPWQCLGCDATIFHDTDYCYVCETSGLLAGQGDRSLTAEGFFDWIDGESYLRFLPTITVIAGVELALTAGWLLLLLEGRALLPI